MSGSGGRGFPPRRRTTRGSDFTDPKAPSETLIPFAGPADTARPALIRQALAGGRFKRVGAPADPLGPAAPVPLPKGRQIVGKVIAVISNWGNFKLEPQIRDAEELLHLPLRDRGTAGNLASATTQVGGRFGGGGRRH